MKKIRESYENDIASMNVSFNTKACFYFDEQFKKMFLIALIFISLMVSSFNIVSNYGDFWHHVSALG